MLRDNFMHGLKTFLRSLLAIVMCLFVYISIQFISISICTKNIGYTVFTVEDGVRQDELYTYYNSDGEDTRYAEYEAQGYELTKLSIRSQLTPTQNTVTQLISQLFCIMILIAVIYPRIWDLGTGDNNKVKFNHMSEDKLRGVKIGAIAAIPSLLAYILLVLSRAGVLSNAFFAAYKLLNVHMMGYTNILFGLSMDVMQQPLWKLLPALLPVIILPAVCGGAYLLGYKDISISEKLIYKNKKGKD